MVCSRDDVRLVDVLSGDHYREEHIKEALSIPLEGLETWAHRLLREDDRIVTYCAGFSCAASTKAANKLVAMGFRHVFDYKGGLEDAKKGGLPMEGARHWEPTRIREFPCPVRN